jgi:hypothetical protein
LRHGLRVIQENQYIKEINMNTDWFPATRQRVLAMANTWIAVGTGKRNAWGIAGVALTELTARRDAAQAALALIEDPGTRTTAKRLCLLAWSLAA